jgi:hypothetical protein
MEIETAMDENTFDEWLELYKKVKIVDDDKNDENLMLDRNSYIDTLQNGCIASSQDFGLGYCILDFDKKEIDYGEGKLSYEDVKNYEFKEFAELFEEEEEDEDEKNYIYKCLEEICEIFENMKYSKLESYCYCVMIEHCFEEIFCYGAHAFEKNGLKEISKYLKKDVI